MIVAGGTGGHLFPAIRLAEEIRLQRLGEILFVTSCRTQDSDILGERNLTFETVPVIGIQSRGVLAILNFVVRLLAGTVKSFVVLLRFRPSVVIGFGGYVSGPIVLLASLFGVRTIIHEQNVYPGKTNRILAKFVNRIAVSFPETMKYFTRFGSKLILSGNPLRSGLRRNQRTEDTFIVLAMGGSQGAHVLNKIIPDAVGSMQADRKKALEIIHISGYKEKDEVIKAYQDKGIKHSVISFIGEIQKLYNECDFVIARSGATTVSELLYLAMPSILIPYPRGNGHQRLNAKVLENIGSAILIEEHGLTAVALRSVIVKFMDRNILARMSRSAEQKRINTKNACSILIDMIDMITIK